MHRHAISAALAPGDGGFARADWRIVLEYHTGMAAHLLDAEYGAALRLLEPETLAFEDHLSYVYRSPAHLAQGLVSGERGLPQAHRAFVARHAPAARAFHTR